MRFNEKVYLYLELKKKKGITEVSLVPVLSGNRVPSCKALQLHG